MITMIGVGVKGPVGSVASTSNLSFASGFLAVTDIVSDLWSPSYSKNILRLGLPSDLRICRPCCVLHVHFRDEEARGKYHTP